MAQNNPFDMTQYFQAFDPQAMARMFDPQSMFAMFQPPQTPPVFDMDAVIKANQRNFEAMTEANKAAAEAYKDLLDKQMEIFAKLTQAARQQYDWAEDKTNPDQMKAKTAAMNEAVEEALALMKKLAEATREANEEAFSKVKGQVDEAVDGMKNKG